MLYYCYVTDMVHFRTANVILGHRCTCFFLRKVFRDCADVKHMVMVTEQILFRRANAYVLFVSSF